MDDITQEEVINEESCNAVAAAVEVLFSLVEVGNTHFKVTGTLDTGCMCTLLSHSIATRNKVPYKPVPLVKLIAANSKRMNV